MKKISMLAMMLLLVAGLAACGGDGNKDNNNETPNNNAGENAGNETGNENAAGNEENAGNDDAADVDNDFYAKAVEVLEEKGYELSNINDGDPDFFIDTVSSFAVEINGEDMLPLQIFEIDPDSEHLASAKETGMGPAEFEGEVAEIPVLVVDNYYVFLGEGHPDYEDIYAIFEQGIN